MADTGTGRVRLNVTPRNVVVVAGEVARLLFGFLTGEDNGGKNAMGEEAMDDKESSDEEVGVLMMVLL